MFNVKTSLNKCHAELLAPELLVMIFHDNITLHERNPIILLPTSIEREPKENEVDTKPLHTLSHVCRYWREVALGTPALWRRIHGRCHDQMEVFLQRSRPLPVTLFLSVVHWGGQLEGPAPAHMAFVIKAHGGRLCRLDLSMVPTREHVVPLLTSLQAPHLQTLTITSPYLFPASDADTISREPLLNGEASSLRALALMPVVNWMPSCTSFPNLTHLSISFHRMVVLYHPFDLLQLLSNVPALAFLHVDFLMDDVSYSGDWHPPSDLIPLPHLRSMFFTFCSSQLMRAVVSRLSLPEDVFIRLRDIFDFEVDSPAPLPPLALRPATSLDLSMRDTQILMVADGSESGVWFEGHHNPRQVPAPAGSWETWLLGLRECLTLTHVTHLHVYVDAAHTFWPEFLTKLPQVSHLAALLGGLESIHPSDVDVDVVASSPTTILCNALSPTPTAPIRCPVLHKLAIEWQKETTPFETAATFPRIPAMLRARAHSGHPIRHVVVQAAPHSLSSGTGATAPLDVFQDFAPSSIPDETEYEIVEREDGAKGLCAFDMRDVWKVEGEDKYWDVDDNDKPRYVLPPWM